MLTIIENDAKRNEFKAVVITTPPFGMLKIAKQVAEPLHLPPIMDMRDAWTFWNLNEYGTYFHFLSNKMLERKYLKADDKVLAASHTVHRIGHFAGSCQYLQKEI